MATNKLSNPLRIIISKHKLISSCFIISILAIISCFLFFINKRSLPGVDFPMHEMNKYIEIYTPKDMNSFKLRQMFIVDFYNLSKNPVLFTRDDFYLFQKTKGKWVHVRSDFISINHDFQLPPKTKIDGQTWGRGSISATLNLYEIKLDEFEPITIRVVLIGHEMENGLLTERKVGGYTDFVLHP